ncbi:glycosyltransferase family 71 protein [Xylaria palmicola]|nr:glycosyltransferase family 71 protein [Xylaria palmicola]
MTSAFFKTALGPKEGRLPPGLLSPAKKDRRRLGSRQKHALLFGTVLVVFLIYFICLQPYASDGFERPEQRLRKFPFVPDRKGPIPPKAPYKQGDQRLPFGSRKHLGTSNVQEPIVEEAGKGEEKPKNTAANKPVTASDSKTNVHQPKIKPASKSASKPEPENESPHLNQWAERPTLKKDMEAIFALFPEEMSMRELLRPIEGGGPERMRELGLRTRTYQKYLSAWEKLHLVHDKETGETHVRDDLIQYLRSIHDEDDDSDDNDDNDEENASAGSSSLTSTIHNYDAFRSFLTKFARILFPFTHPYSADHMTLHSQFKNAGRGIVLTAGDDQARYLLTTIYTFRKIGCDLPIEIMYLGDGDLGEDHRVELEALPGVTTRDISGMVDDDGWKLAGWAIKPFAMLLSSFREVIFVDADSFFFRDPARLFDDPDYVKTGALFFRDRTIMPESKRRWLLQILPRPIPRLAMESSWWTGVSGHHQESGVVVIDKWKHFVAMLLICRFNGSDRDPRDGKMGVYEMMHGDKETFWIGFLLAGDPSFAFHKGAVGSIGVVEPPPSVTPTPAALESSTTATDELTASPTSSSSSSIKEPRGLSSSSSLTATEAPETYTMCSPQLLHLDVDGTPLWFNGWLLVSKYAERARRRFAPMTSYLREPVAAAANVGADVDADADADFWKLTTDNMCCLTAEAEAKRDLTDKDLALLSMMRSRALAVGVMD